MKPSARWAALLWALVLVVFSAPAVAGATLTGSFMNAVCGIDSPLGRTTVACQNLGPFTGGPGFRAGIGPGETAFVDATLHIDYTDDGLRLAPGQIAFVQLDANGIDVRQLFQEAGVIYLHSNLCQGRGCSFPLGVDAIGVGFPPIVVGENDIADHIVQDIPVFSRVSVSSANGVGFSTNVFVDWVPVAFSSSLQPVPEPGTWALLLTGLALCMLRKGAHSQG